MKVHWSDGMWLMSEIGKYKSLLKISLFLSQEHMVKAST